MKLLYCMLLLLCPYLSHTQPLNIGDTVSTASLQHILHAPAFNPITNPANNKLIILDFMATSCSSCIEALPAMQGLQQQFNKPIQIILVTRQSSQKIKSFLEKSSIGKTIQLPIIANDTLLQQLFPHRYISHLVWIDSGRVKAITGSKYVNAANISQLLAGKRVSWPIKKDADDFDYSQPLIVPGINVTAGAKPTGVYYSAVLPYLPGAASYYNKVKGDPGASARISIINMPVADIYLCIFKKPRFPKSQVVLQVSDSSLFIPAPNTSKADWMAKRAFCFETRLPATISLEKQAEKLAADLAFYTGITARWERRTLSCRVIQKSNQPVAEGTSKSEEGLTIGTIAYTLNNAYTGMPVLIEPTGAGNVRLPITTAELYDEAVLKKALAGKGYQVLKAERELEVLVLRGN